MKELFQKSGKVSLILGRNIHRLASIETNVYCNRRCDECAVPLRYNKENESTLTETKSQIDWLHKEGFRILTYMGGEPLAPFRTKEGITFLEHTIEAVRYASEKGMMVNVTTNGDYVSKKIIEQLKSVGLDKLTFSAHSFTERELTDLMDKARMTARMGITSVAHVILTSRSADVLPEIALRAAESGVFISTNIVQEMGKGFSTVPEQSQIPTAEQARKAFSTLLKLKPYGFVVTDRNYLIESPDSIEKKWKCDPNVDAFIHIGAGGYLNICPDNRTDIKATDISLSDPKWRELKQELVRGCKGCNHQCWIASENPHVIKDIVPLTTMVIVALIRTGHAGLVEKLGKFAVQRIRSSS